MYELKMKPPMGMGEALAGGDWAGADGLALAGEEGFAWAGEGLALAGEEGLAWAGADRLALAGEEGLAAAGLVEGCTGELELMHTDPEELKENLVGLVTRLERRDSLLVSGVVQSLCRRPPVLPESGLRHQKNWLVKP